MNGMIMYVVVYVTIAEVDKNIEVNGPFYYGCHSDIDGAEELAREVTNSKTKDVIISHIISQAPKNRLSDTMTKARKTWYPRFVERTQSVAAIIHRDINAALCPFRDLPLDDVMHLVAL